VSDICTEALFETDVDAVREINDLADQARALDDLRVSNALEDLAEQNADDPDDGVAWGLRYFDAQRAYAESTGDTDQFNPGE